MRVIPFAHRRPEGHSRAALFLLCCSRRVPAPAQTYMGPSKCVGCHDHERQARKWQKEEPAAFKGKAHYNTLKQLDAPKSAQWAKAIGLADPYDVKGSCVKCHATVFRGDANAGVSCESCHGPSSKYNDLHQQKGSYAQSVAAGLVDLKEKPPTIAKVCVECHVSSDKQARGRRAPHGRRLRRGRFAAEARALGHAPTTTPRSPRPGRRRWAAAPRPRAPAAAPPAAPDPRPRRPPLLRLRRERLRRGVPAAAPAAAPRAAGQGAGRRPASRRPQRPRPRPPPAPWDWDQPVAPAARRLRARSRCPRRPGGRRRRRRPPPSRVAARRPSAAPQPAPVVPPSLAEETPAARRDLPGAAVVTPAAPAAEAAAAPAGPRPPAAEAVALRGEAVRAAREAAARGRAHQGRPRSRQARGILGPRRRAAPTAGRGPGPRPRGPEAARMSPALDRTTLLRALRAPPEAHGAGRARVPEAAAHLLRAFPRRPARRSSRRCASTSTW